MIREAIPDDFEAVMRLYGQLHRQDPILDDGRDRVTFHAILGTPGLSLLVMEVEGTVVATTYLNVIPNITRSASPYAVIENVVVDEALRGTGLGTQIMLATLELAWAAGCYKAMLLTGSREPSTHAFYQRCGFSPDSKTAYLAPGEAALRVSCVSAPCRLGRSILDRVRRPSAAPSAVGLFSA